MRSSGSGRADACSWNAYLTVFLSLSLTVILSLFFTLMYGARVNGVRMQTEMVTDVAENSCLAEFSRALLEEYDLFFIDTSYGSGQGSVMNTQQHLEEYLRRNCEGSIAGIFGGVRSLCSLRPESSDITATRFACDRDYEAVLEQITAYMSMDPKGAAAEKVLSLADSFRGAGLNLDEWDREKTAVDRGFDEAREAATDESAAGAEGDGSSGADSSAAIPENPGKAMDEFRSTPILSQVFGDGGNISAASVNTGELLSHRQLQQGDGLEAESSHHYDRAQAPILDSYLFEKCGDYRKTEDQSPLQYELEYILCGKGSDRENLEGTFLRIGAVRTAANCVYLFSNGKRRSEAEAMAASLAAVTLTPALGSLYLAAILLAWGYAESVQDMKILAEGGKVPLLKDDASWQTDVHSILDPSKNTDHTGCERGLTYEDYLRIFLFLEAEGTKVSRFLDICELNVRRTPGNEGFRMDWCMDSFTAQVVMNSSIGYQCSVTKTVTYN